jgi:two-component system LytT family sensor kinase
MKFDHHLRQSINKWLLIFGGWTFAAAFLAGHQSLQSYFSENPVSFVSLLRWQLASSYGWFALMPLILWLTKKFSPEGELFHRNLSILISTGMFIILLQLAINALVLPALGYPPYRKFATYTDAFRFMFLTNFPWSLLIYFTILGSIFMTRYYRKARERELRAARLESNLARARLQVLKMQLHPHFLFNTHNAISELIHKDPDAAERVLTNLSDLLRISLEKLDVEEVPLEQELEFLKKYVEIEQTRFQDRLQLKMNIAPETLDAVVPNMLLQPLIENAVKHGITPLKRGGTIEIESAKKNGHLLLRISDDGVGIGDRCAKNLVKGIGLANTKARLIQLYKNDQSMEIEPNRERGLSVKLKIPFKREKPAERETQHLSII